MVTAGRSAMATRSPVRAVTLLFGAIFLLIGVAGFIPGVTTHYGELGFAGEESTAEILGLFQISVLHNVVHLLFGVVAVAMARSETGARTYLVGAGTIYLVLWIFGLVVHGEEGQLPPGQQRGQLAAPRAGARPARARAAAAGVAAGPDRRPGPLSAALLTGAARRPAQASSAGSSARRSAGRAAGWSSAGKAAGTLRRCLFIDRTSSTSATTRKQDEHQRDRAGLPVLGGGSASSGVMR